MLYRKVNLDTGMFIEDIETFSPIDASYISTPVPSDIGFYWPKWDFVNNQWVEGLTAEEIAEMQNVPPPPPTLEERVEELTTKTNEILELLNPPE